MCFIIDEKHPNKLTAKRDITCYKVLDKDYKSIVRKFQYKLGEVYKGYIDKPIVSRRSINEIIYNGFHSFSNKETARYIAKDYSWRAVRDYSKRKLYGVIVKCIIPKGSEYYYNSYIKEYVSNQIIIKEVL